MVKLKILCPDCGLVSIMRMDTTFYSFNPAPFECGFCAAKSQWGKDHTTPGTTLARFLIGGYIDGQA